MLNNLLAERRAAILKRWFDIILETYPADTSHFLKEQKNRFANPVGHTISQGMEGVLEGLINGQDNDRAVPFIDSVVRVMAVQEIKPSGAASFVLFLKQVIRKELEKEILENRTDGRLDAELSGLESRIDALTLLTFDLYVQCREKLYELRANETKRMTFRLLQRANLVREVRNEPDLLHIETESKMKRGN